MPRTTPHPSKRAELEGDLVSGIEPFDLFCAYHLGITEENRYRFQNVHQVAQRFHTSVEAVQEALKAYALDPDTLIHVGFDLASAQADVQLSPEGVDLTVLARMHFEALLEAEPEGRDWEAELRQAEEENREIFGNKGR